MSDNTAGQTIGRTTITPGSEIKSVETELNACVSRLSINNGELAGIESTIRRVLERLDGVSDEDKGETNHEVEDVCGTLPRLNQSLSEQEARIGRTNSLLQRLEAIG